MPGWQVSKLNNSVKIGIRGILTKVVALWSSPSGQDSEVGVSNPNPAVVKQTKSMNWAQKLKDGWSSYNDRKDL